MRRVELSLLRFPCGILSLPLTLGFLPHITHQCLAAIAELSVVASVPRRHQRPRQIVSSLLPSASTPSHSGASEVGGAGSGCGRRGALSHTPAIPTGHSAPTS